MAQMFDYIRSQNLYDGNLEVAKRYVGANKIAYGQVILLLPLWRFRFSQGQLVLSNCRQAERAWSARDDLGSGPVD